MNKGVNPADSRILSIIDIGLSFSAMLRLYGHGSKEEMRKRIHVAREQLWEAKSQEAFTNWHSSICNWGISNIWLTDHSPASYGQIAKTLDVVLKVAIYYCHLPDCEGAAKLSPWLNAAVDNKMMRMLRRSYPDAFKHWPTSVRQVDSREKYEVVQGLVRRYISEEHPDVTPVQFDDIYWWKLNRQVCVES